MKRMVIREENYSTCTIEPEKILDERKRANQFGDKFI